MNILLVILICIFAQIPLSALASNNATAGQACAGPQSDLDFGPYIAELEHRISVVWHAPKKCQNMRVVVVFYVSRDGNLSGLRLVNPSGHRRADKAALSAIEKSAPFRPLIDGAPERIGLQFSFDRKRYPEGVRAAFFDF